MEASKITDHLKFLALATKKHNVESTALRLITTLGSSEVQPQFTHFLSDPRTVLSAESEELNRALILTLARATHVTDFSVNNKHALFQAFSKQNNVPQESHFKKNVEEEYRKWKSMTNENDIITHFSMQGSPPLFLCLLWKMLLETDHINQIGYREVKDLPAVSKVWAMRSHEGDEAQVCYFIIQLLLLKPNDFRNRKYPEKLYFEGLAEQVNPPVQIQPQYLPIYFGNVCLRFLPVFDIVIHRFLELLPVSKSLETRLDHLGGLYKFHDRPVTYLYNTLHYYERHLRERTNLKRKLVHAIIGSLKDNRPQGWCLSDTYIKSAMNV
ncbi:solute carrier family 13 member 2 [Platysternon megacephalum]|uniref:Mediator of RNA polymerase II transcription subunit 23 n=1 Tax=Platysternon megacephalum TaxID=55544 RepID=A0A4D9E0B7_9SAUR|nr:solute carrier family 13 member 2 [Platysternon megacephalum]